MHATHTHKSYPDKDAHYLQSPILQKMSMCCATVAQSMLELRHTPHHPTMLLTIMWTNFVKKKKTIMWTNTTGKGSYHILTKLNHRFN